MNRYIIFSAMGAELIGISIGCVIIGQYLDGKRGWPGYATAGMLILGLIGWFIHILQLLKKINEQENNPKSSKEQS